VGGCVPCTRTSRLRRARLTGNKLLPRWRGSSSSEIQGESKARHYGDEDDDENVGLLASGTGLQETIPEGPPDDRDRYRCHGYEFTDRESGSVRSKERP
jgi:hypothetical protein